MCDQRRHVGPCRPMWLRKKTLPFFTSYLGMLVASLKAGALYIFGAFRTSAIRTTCFAMPNADDVTNKSRSALPKSYSLDEDYGTHRHQINVPCQHGSTCPAANVIAYYTLTLYSISRGGATSQPIVVYTQKYIPFLCLKVGKKHFKYRHSPVRPMIPALLCSAATTFH